MPGPLRTPRVEAQVALGPVDVVFSVKRLKTGALDVRPPITQDNAEAVVCPDEMWAAIAAVVLAAVRADPAAMAALRRGLDHWKTRTALREGDHR